MADFSCDNLTIAGSLIQTVAADSYFLGKLGIGKAEPAAPLVVANSVVPSQEIFMLFQNSGSGYEVNKGLYVGLGGGQSGWVFNYQNAPLCFGTNYGEVMRFDTSFRVGIGTATPGWMLNVLGNVRASGSYYAGARKAADSAGCYYAE